MPAVQNTFDYRLTAEKEELERENSRLATQRRDIEEASLKRQAEHDRLLLDHQTVLDELSQAKSAKCEALVQIQVRKYYLKFNCRFQLKLRYSRPSPTKTKLFEIWPTDLSNCVPTKKFLIFRDLASFHTKNLSDNELYLLVWL